MRFRQLREIGACAWASAVARMIHVVQLLPSLDGPRVLCHRDVRKVDEVESSVSGRLTAGMRLFSNRLTTSESLSIFGKTVIGQAQAERTVPADADTHLHRSNGSNLTFPRKSPTGQN